MLDWFVQHKMIGWVAWGILSAWYVYEYLGMRLGEATAKKNVRYNRFGFPRHEDLDEFGQRHRRRVISLLVVAFAWQGLLWVLPALGGAKP